MHRFLTLLAAIVLAAPVLAQTAPSFTYQGQFTDNGAPADGVYDIVVQVYDAASGGTLLSSGLVLDYDVEGGLFSIDVDAAPGGTPLFDGSDRWVQVGFRDGALSIFDPFTFTGRTLVAHAPQSVYALTAGALADPIWEKNTFFDSAFWGDGDSRVGINTIFAFSDATLAVHKETSGTHGIVVSTSGPGGSPFLDLQTGAGGDPMGSRVRFTYEGTGGTLRVGPTGSDWMTLASGAGLEVITGGVAANDFSYRSSQQRLLSVSQAAWQPTSDLDYVINDGSNGNVSYIDQVVALPEELHAPLSLPDGAVIESVLAYYRCVGAAQLRFGILRTPHNGGTANFIGFDVLSSGTANPWTQTTNAGQGIIDNGTFSYSLVALSADWDSAGAPPVGVGGVVVRYRVSEPD